LDTSLLGQHNMTTSDTVETGAVRLMFFNEFNVLIRLHYIPARYAQQQQTRTKF
jgi:hypothetical protein